MRHLKFGDAAFDGNHQRDEKLWRDNLLELSHEVLSLLVRIPRILALQL
jgi:hypothetical protein